MRAAIHRWTAGPLGPAVEASLARLATLEGAVHVAVMPDAHLARDVCVGAVLATEDRFVPAAVGGDIGCGMAAVAFDAASDLLASPDAAARVLAAFERRIPFLKHRRMPALPASLAAFRPTAPALQAAWERDGRYQLGTLGRGNHFVELQADGEERLWLMVHTGSRSFGRAVLAHHAARGRRDGATGLAVLDARSAEGQAYAEDMASALAYAAASRRCIVAAVAEALATLFGVAVDPSTLRECHHNHAAREEHFGRSLLVHRKGAIPAGVGVAGIVPGSMGTWSVHVEGRGNPLALCSSSHGAGRAMSRSEARRRIDHRSFRRRMQGIWYDHRRTSSLVDEAPEAYRDLGAVLRAQHDLTRLVRRLRPLLVYKS